MPLYPHPVPGSLYLLERDGRGGSKGHDLPVQNAVRSGQDGLEGVQIGGLSRPGLGLVLYDKPEFNPF